MRLQVLHKLLRRGHYPSGGVRAHLLASQLTSSPSSIGTDASFDTVWSRLESELDVVDWQMTHEYFDHVVAVRACVPACCSGVCLHGTWHVSSCALLALLPTRACCDAPLRSMSRRGPLTCRC
jgi:hypothetical protein